MKQAQNARKQRGRSAPRKGGKNNGSAGNRSNEPKVRGNPKQLLEKYKNQAREAKQAGDRVQAEYYYQFADHYQRILNDMAVRNGQQPGADSTDDNTDDPQGGKQQQQQRRGRGRRPRDRDNGAPEAAADQNAEGNQGNGETAIAADPATEEQPVEVHPELDLDGAAAPDAEEKPKRRRAPVQRRRSPRAKAAEAADVVDGAAEKAAPANPEGNEAA